MFNTLSLSSYGCLSVTFQISMHSVDAIITLGLLSTMIFIVA